MNYDKIISIFSPHVENIANNFMWLYYDAGIRYEMFLNEVEWLIMVANDPSLLPVVGC